MGKKSSACEPCAKKRIGCDSTRPSCLKCLDSGRTCTYERSEETRRRDRNVKAMERNSKAKEEVLDGKFSPYPMVSGISPPMPSYPSYRPAISIPTIPMPPMPMPMPGVMDSPLSLTSPIPTIHSPMPMPGPSPLPAHSPHPGPSPMPSSYYDYQQPMVQASMAQPSMNPYQQQYYSGFYYQNSPAYPNYPTDYSGSATPQAQSTNSPISQISQITSPNDVARLPKQTQVSLEQLIDQHRQITLDPQPGKIRKPDSIYNHHAIFDNYFVLRDFFKNRYVYTSTASGIYIDPTFWEELIKIVLDSTYIASFTLHFPTWLKNPGSIDEATLLSHLVYSIIVVDGATSLEHYSEAKNNYLTVLVLRRTLTLCQRNLVSLISPSKTLSTAIALSALAFVFTVFDRKNVMSERFLSIAVSLMRELKLHDLSPIEQEIAIRATWTLYMFDRSGCIVSFKALVPDDVIENLPLPSSDEIFQKPNPNLTNPMPILNQLLTPESLEHYWHRLDPMAVACIVFRMQDLILQKKMNQAMIERMLTYLEKRINAIPIPPGLSSNDPMLLHPKHVLMQLYLTWTYLYLPSNVMTLTDDEWAEKNPHEFEQSMKMIGLAAQEMTNVIQDLDFCSLGQMPHWIFPSLVKITLLFIILLKNVKENSDEFIDDLLKRCKMFVIGLRYAALNDRSLHTVIDLLESMIGQGEGDLAKSQFADALTNLFVEKFPLLQTGTMPPEFIEFVLPVTTAQGKIGLVECICGQGGLTDEEMSRDPLELVRKEGKLKTA